MCKILSDLINFFFRVRPDILSYKVLVRQRIILYVRTRQFCKRFVRSYTMKILKCLGFTGDESIARTCWLLVDLKHIFKSKILILSCLRCTWKRAPRLSSNLLRAAKFSLKIRIFRKSCFLFLSIVGLFGYFWLPRSPFFHFRTIRISH